MLGGSVIKVVSCCKINYFGHFSTIIEDFDWTKTVGEVKGSFFSWSFPPWWPKSTKSHDLVFENSITGATGTRKSFVHVNLPKPISFWSNRISFKEWGLFLTMPPPKKYFWALRRAVSSLHQSKASKPGWKEVFLKSCNISVVESLRKHGGPLSGTRWQVLHAIIRVTQHRGGFCKY